MLTVLYVLGLTAESMTAALAAGRQRMDMFGVMLIASVTAFGGGTVRDLLFGHYPLRWVDEPIFLAIVLGAALVTVLASFLMDYFRTVFLVLDAVGLSTFALLGAQVALELGYNPLIVIVSSVVTGVFGGVLRDVLCDRVPLVFSEELYASIAILVAVMYMGMLHFNLDETIGSQLVIVICLIFAFGLRLLAIFYRISLPVFEYQEREYVRDPAGRLTMWALNKAGVQRREMRRRSVGAPKAPKDKTGQKKRKRKNRFELVDRGEYEYGDDQASQNPHEEPRNSDE
ncbi:MULTISPECIES: trimeric intracellular cation channel family protein [unclassified Corynebacterium]|uniref:trimeric intracellular cation channel family protein n=1 Tax=unclassified Corynebacterium TaxID=2624378 RepID=UPI001EF6787D|nr:MULTISPECIES: trimeric intracellular cation channel family protein [unclassified Corynebacterium]MCG7258756.1 trimeric intracellular cation channel family protein [Corynebacterium sp. ACRQK]MCG7263756.1 trimeric intracellular cation channel family protein [Corynebacterium sp. ACRQL]